MKDATKALKINPDSTKAIIAQGEALYSMGEFEKGLIQFQRGWRTRQDPKMKIGLLKCKDAIANAVGPNAKEFDIDLVQKVIENMEEEKKDPNKQKLPGRTLAEQAQFLSKKKLALLRRKREAKRNKIDRLLLGDVAKDATFLRRLAGIDLEKETADQEMTKCQENVIKIAKEALGYLEKRRNFWQQIASCRE